MARARKKPPTPTTSEAIQLVAQTIYDARGDVSPAQQRFLTAVHQITMSRARAIGAAALAFGDGSKTYLATCYLADLECTDRLSTAFTAFTKARNAELED